jgi:hypothetical protein
MTTVTGRDVTPSEAEQAAENAFLFGYPLVLMGRMQAHSPAATFVHERAPSGPPAPAADAVASTAWLDLSEQPVVLSVPDSHGQYYLLSLVDMWTTVFASLGPRTTGTGAGHYAISSPHWNGGTLPAGVHPITAPTDTVRASALFQLDRRGVHRVHALQDGCGITPLSDWNRRRHHAATTVADVAAPGLAPAEQLERMEARTYFAELAALLEAHPPLPGDRALVERLRHAGVLPYPGEPMPDDPQLQMFHERGLRRGRLALRAAAAEAQQETFGNWSVRYGLVSGGTDHLRRAAAACIGQFSSRAADEVEAVVTRDAAGAPLSGTHAYRLRFDDQPPPVRGFWSLSCGGATIGDADGLTIGTDGSLTLAIQSEPPGALEPRSNWLAAPPGEFALILRLFWPTAAVLQRRWWPPAVTRIA